MEQLIQHAINGEKHAMRDLLLRHRNLIESVVARFLWNRTLWEDVMQNIFMKIMTSISEFSGKCLFSTWLYRIAVNECIEANRRQSRWTKRINGQQEFNDIFPDPNAPDGLTMSIKNEVHSAVRDSVSRLPEGMRKAFELIYDKQCSGNEAARELNITVQALFVRLSAARNKLKEDLLKRGILS